MEHLKIIGGELAMGSQAGFGQSKEFLDLVKSIGEARSKAEEDRIVLREIETLKRRIVEPDIPKRKMKEYIIRLVYVEMLGNDASFGYIHAVKMTHDDSLSLKRTGYLAVTLFLSEDHDLIILIVNTIQKDLKSDNYLVICAALNAVCKLINEETIPAVLPSVVDLMDHPKEAVRKKAIMALHRFHQKSPSSVSHLIPNFCKRLCDKDPGVMGAALCPLFDLTMKDVNSFKELVVSFVSILKQVAERRLPKAYDYHLMPAPFVQIKLLKILALIGSGDKQASEHIYNVLGELFKKCDPLSNIGNAVLYECICCVSSLYPNNKLLEASADVIARFLKSDGNNLKYMGIDALGRLIKLNPEIAEQHQLAVIDCLEDPDDTLKRKTFELMYKMTKPSNVEVIVDRMIDYMITINDNHYKTETASRCVELAEQFAPSNQWFIQTMNKVFKHAGDLVNIKVAHNLMRLIAEGFGEDDDAADSQLRASAVESYLRILGEPKLPSLFLQVICWVFGEYGTIDGKFTASYITGKLCDVAETYSNDENVKAYAVTALLKIYAFEISCGRTLDILPECQSLIEELSASHSADLQQRAYELQAVIGLDPKTVRCIMPSDASCEDVEIEKDIPFLNAYVQQAIEKGASPYILENQRSGVQDYRNQEHHEVSSHALRFEAYDIPKPSIPSDIVSVSSISPSFPEPITQSSFYRENHATGSLRTSEFEPSEIKLRLDGIQKKWGQPTYFTPSTSQDTTSKITNGSMKGDSVSASTSRTQEISNDSGRTAMEITPEKQKLAASLFGGPSNAERKVSSVVGGRIAKGTTHSTDKQRFGNEVVTPLTGFEVDKKPQVQAPDLLDLGEPVLTISSPVSDPFKQLEDLLDPTQVTIGRNQVPDLMGDSVETSGAMNDLSFSTSNPSRGVSTVPSKGENAKASLVKDALVRQLGVTPSQQNPNLFKDLLG